MASVVVYRSLITYVEMRMGLGPCSPGHPIHPHELLNCFVSELTFFGTFPDFSSLQVFCTQWARCHCYTCCSAGPRHVHQDWRVPYSSRIWTNGPCYRALDSRAGSR